jgi:hypothetical protein
VGNRHLVCVYNIKKLACPKLTYWYGNWWNSSNKKAGNKIMFTIEKLPGEAITIITINGSILKNMVSEDREQVQHQVQSIVEETPGLDYLIMDLHDIELTFSELVMVLAKARDQIAMIGGKTYIDANMRYLLVGSDELIDLAAEALHQEQYGNIEVQVFPTVGAAVDFARSELTGQTRPTVAG